jgi:flagellar assembly factor FliW
MSPVQTGTRMAAIPTQAHTPELPALEFVGPVAGFPELRSFVLTELDPDSVVRSLRSLDDPDVRFLVIPPGPFFPDYVPEISGDWAETLGLADADDALVLVIVNFGSSLAEATVNLLAPVVINTGTRRAAQVVLADTALSLRAPLPVG